MSAVLTPVLSRETKALEDQASHICRKFLLLDVSCPEKVSFYKGPKCLVHAGDFRQVASVLSYQRGC